MGIPWLCPSADACQMLLVDIKAWTTLWYIGSFPFLRCLDEKQAHFISPIIILGINFEDRNTYH